jgi:spore coat polysaccharide biosynthesis predicted glycosyltransferase SpsG
MPHVAIRCDVTGTERLTRCLALADGLLARDVPVTFVGAGESAWAALQVGARGLEMLPATDAPQEQAEQLGRRGAGVLVADTAGFGRASAEAVRAAGVRTLVVLGASSPDVAADLVVVPGIRAEAGRRAGRDAAVLGGVEYTLLRNDVLANRPIAAPEHADVEVPRVAVVDDGRGLARRLGEALVRTGRPFDATLLVAEDAGGERAAAGLRPDARQQVAVTAPGPRVHELLARSHVLLGGAGWPTYEWLCLGAAVGLVRVDDAAEVLYRDLMVRRVVLGLGSPDALADAAAVDKVTRLLADARERSRLADEAWHLVDGQGRDRVVDALLARS